MGDAPRWATKEITSLGCYRRGQPVVIGKKVPHLLTVQLLVDAAHLPVDRDERLKRSSKGPTPHSVRTHV
jgi:hypothetical protein